VLHHGAAAATWLPLDVVTLGGRIYFLLGDTHKSSDVSYYAQVMEHLQHTCNVKLDVYFEAILEGRTSAVWDMGMKLSHFAHLARRLGCDNMRFHAVDLRLMTVESPHGLLDDNDAAFDLATLKEAMPLMEFRLAQVEDFMEFVRRFASVTGRKSDAHSRMLIQNLYAYLQSKFAATRAKVKADAQQATEALAAAMRRATALASAEEMGRVREALEARARALVLEKLRECRRTLFFFTRQLMDVYVTARMLRSVEDSKIRILYAGKKHTQHVCKILSKMPGAVVVQQMSTA
jgi:hypothetical protein